MKNVKKNAIRRLQRAIEHNKQIDFNIRDISGNGRFSTYQEMGTPKYFDTKELTLYDDIDFTSYKIPMKNIIWGTLYTYWP